MIFGRFLGGPGRQNRPKSTKMASETCSICDAFSDLRFYRFSIDFRRVLGSKMTSEIDAFGVRIRSRRIWAETSKFGESITLFDVFPRSGASKIHQKSIEKRSWIQDPFRIAFRDSFRTISGRFWTPKRSQKGSGTELRGTPKNRLFSLPVL